MIRTHTFLKYARINLQEAEAAIQHERFQEALRRCADAGVALKKAVGASFSEVRDDPQEMDENALARLVARLAGDAREAGGIARAIQALGDLPAAGDPSRTRAEQALAFAGETFQRVHDLCVC